MTSLHDLRFSLPPIQNPGYAYALNYVEYELHDLLACHCIIACMSHNMIARHCMICGLAFPQFKIQATPMH